MLGDSSTTPSFRPLSANPQVYPKLAVCCWFDWAAHILPGLVVFFLYYHLSHQWNSNSHFKKTFSNTRKRVSKSLFCIILFEKKTFYKYKKNLNFSHTMYAIYKTKWLRWYGIRVTEKNEMNIAASDPLMQSLWVWFTVLCWLWEPFSALLIHSKHRKSTLDSLLFLYFLF